MIDAGIFGTHSNFEDRFIADHNRLARLVQYWQEMGLCVVLTHGTFDLIHLGHEKYLEAARSCGDLLIVAVDTDDAVRARKGPNRPIVSEEERLRMLVAFRTVDVVTTVGKDCLNWELFKKLKPSVLVESESTNDPRLNKEKIEELKQFCDDVRILPPQAETSTTAMIRRLVIDGIKGLSPQFKEKLLENFSDMVDRALQGITKEEKGDSRAKS